VFSKIKLEFNLEVILSILAVSYFVIIAIHYFSYQNDIDKVISEEQSLNLQLDKLQEKNNQDASNEGASDNNYIQDIIRINNNFIALLADVIYKAKFHENYSYNRILKKNNAVFINLQYNKSQYKNNASEILGNLNIIYKNFEYIISKIRKFDDFIKIYLNVNLN